jgi:hypothetical protein
MFFRLKEEMQLVLPSWGSGYLMRKDSKQALPLEGGDTACSSSMGEWISHEEGY